MGQGKTPPPPNICTGDRYHECPQYLRSQVKLSFVDFMALCFTETHILLNVDKEASASTSAGLRPPEPLPWLCPSPVGDFGPLDPLLCPAPTVEADNAAGQIALAYLEHSVGPFRFRVRFRFTRIVARRLKITKFTANKNIKIEYNRQQDNAIQTYSRLRCSPEF